VKRSGRGLIEGLSQHFPGGTEENHKNLSQDSRSPGMYMNTLPSKYEAGV
jgi:hypothetical protein